MNHDTPPCVAVTPPCVASARRSVGVIRHVTPRHTSTRSPAHERAHARTCANALMGVTCLPTGIYRRYIVGHRRHTLNTYTCDADTGGCDAFEVAEGPYPGLVALRAGQGGDVCGPWIVLPQGVIGGGGR